MGVQIVTTDPFATAPSQARGEPMPAAEASPAPISPAQTGSEAGKPGSKAGKKPQIPASARDEVMRVLFADRGGEGFGQAVRQVGEQLRQKSRESRQPFYDEAFQEGAAGFESPELEKLGQSPLFARAMQRADTTLQDKAAVPGVATTGAQGANGRTLEYWDQVSQRLDDMREVARRSGAADRVEEIDGMRKMLRGQLEKAFGKYQATRGAAELFFDASDPVEAGMKFAVGRYPLVKAGQVLSTLGADEKKLFAEGFAKAFSDMVRAAPDRRAALDKMKLLEGEQNKVRLALGGRADQLEAYLRLEGLFTGGEDAGKAIADVLISGSNMTETPLHRGVAEQIGRKLASRNPDLFLDGLKLASKPEVLEGLRAAGIAKGGQKPGVQQAEPGSDQVYNKARDAIARGADRTAVMKRLSENGINPRGL